MTDMELGGNIILSGFSELDKSELSILKKMIGSYARKFADTYAVTELKITLKEVHKIEKSEKFEIKAAAVKDAKKINSEITDKNLFFAIDTALKKIEAQLI